MKSPNDIQEVAEPLSKGEKSFKAMHTVLLNKKVVPGVTDQDHIFKGLERKKDQPTASYEIYKSEDESKENYDKGLKVKEDPYETEKTEAFSSSNLDAFHRKEKMFKMSGNKSAQAAMKTPVHMVHIHASKDGGPVEVHKEKIEAKTKDKAMFDAQIKYSPKKGYKVKDTVYKGIVKEEVKQVDERHLTNTEMEKREKIAQSLPASDFKKRYGKDWMKVKMATATKMSMKKEETEKDIGVPGGEGIKFKKHQNAMKYVAGNVKDASSNTKDVNAMVKHDCAKHVAHEEWGIGECIPESHTLIAISENEGYVTHYDVMFEHGVEYNVSVDDLKVLAYESHMHAARKSMKEDVDYDYEGEMAKTELRALSHKADALANMMADDQQLEAWLQSKISRAKDQIDAVYDYMMFRDQPTASPEVPMQSDSMASTYGSFLNRMGEEVEQVEEDKEKELAALAPPRDKVTKKDILVGRGVLKPHPNDPEKHVLAKEETLEIKSPALLKAFEKLI